MTSIWIAVAPCSLAPGPRPLAPLLIWHLMSTWSHKLRLFIVLLTLLVFGRLLIRDGRQEWHRSLRQRRLFSRRKRPHEARRHNYQQLIGGLLGRTAAEQIAENRNVTYASHLIQNLGHSIVDQA